MVGGRARRPAGPLGAAHAPLGHPATVARHGAGDVAGGAGERERLYVAGALAQAAVLVEVAAHELDRPVVVRVQHRGAGVVDLAPAGREQVAPKRLVLGVGDLAEADLLPAGARVAGVDVREERRVAVALNDRASARFAARLPAHGAVCLPTGPAARLPARRARGEAREELAQLAGDHRAGVRARQVRPVGGADALIERKRLAVGGEPARDGRGVLGEEADQLAGGALGAEVAGAPVAELGGVDLEQLHARRADDLARAVARARVDHEHLVDPLAREGLQQLLQVALPVLDGDDRGNPAHGSQSRGACCGSSAHGAAAAA